MDARHFILVKRSQMPEAGEFCGALIGCGFIDRLLYIWKRQQEKPKDPLCHRSDTSVPLIDALSALDKSFKLPKNISSQSHAESVDIKAIGDFIQAQKAASTKVVTALSKKK